MNTKTLLILSVLFLAALGLGFSFLPAEILEELHIESNSITTILMQILGALFLGFGMMNWMAKDSIIGGIYNKPLVVGNLMHFGVGAITLLKIVFTLKENTRVLIPLTILYLVFAVAFFLIFKNTPKAVK